MVVLLLTLWVRFREPDPETQADGATAMSYHLAKEEAKDLKLVQAPQLCGPAG